MDFSNIPAVFFVLICRSEIIISLKFSIFSAKIISCSCEIRRTTGTAYDFDFSVPNDLETGDYFFDLLFSDGVNNEGEGVEFEVRVN